MKKHLEIRPHGQPLGRLDKHAARTDVLGEPNQASSVVYHLSGKRGSREAAFLRHAVMDQTKDDLPVLGLDFRKLEACPLFRVQVTDTSVRRNHRQMFGGPELDGKFRAGGELL